jgi:hypothetical protein
MEKLSELSPLEQLDFFLEYLNEQKDFYVFSDTARELSIVHGASKKTYIAHYNDINSILAELQKDGYVTDSEGVYAISFSGRAFLQAGGYVAEYLKQQRIQKAIQINNSWIKWSSITAAVAALLYLLWDFAKYAIDNNWFCRLRCFFCH